MAKRNEPNLPTRVTPAANVPSYLTTYEGFEQDMLEQKAAMGEYIVLPRMKIIQDMTSQELKALADAGSVIFSPGNAVVSLVNKAEMKCEAFDFVPLFFYTEFCQWRDANDKSGDTIIARSFDKAGALAAKARDKHQREEPYGEVDPRSKQPKFKYRFVEHLNFLGIIVSEHPLAGQPCAISFSKGEFTTGCNFITASSMRKTPIWSQVWTFHTKYNVRDIKKWWGWSYSPADEPNIKEEQVQAFREQNRNLREAFDQKRLAVDHSEGDEVAEDPAADHKEY